VPGFSRTRVLSDGERERRVHYGRLTAVETSVDLDQDNALVLRQVSDGSSFLQLILNRHQELVDCEYLKDPRAVLHRGNGSVLCELSSLSTPPSTNDTFRLIRSARDVGADWKELLDLRLLRRKCRKLHRQIRLALREQQGTAGKKKRDLFLYPGTNWCGSGNSARKFTELGVNARADRCCRDHDHCPFTIEAFKKKFHLFNYRFHTVSHCECDE
ncbi:group III secreted phospholipase A2, putative, partial [Ixodes scapularis]